MSQDKQKKRKGWTLEKFSDAMKRDFGPMKPIDTWPPKRDNEPVTDDERPA